MQPLVRSGDGVAADFIAQAEAQFESRLGFRPFHGTLNVESAGDFVTFADRMPWTHSEHCDGVRYTTGYLDGLRAAVIRPIVPDYPDEKFELVAPVKVRDLFGLADGDSITFTEGPWRPDGLETTAAGLNEFDAVVFDFDGTLADLAVDWAGVRTDIHETLEPYLEDDFEAFGQRDIFSLAREHDVYGDIEAILRTAEVDAAGESTARPLLAAVEAIDRPMGICTKNAHDAVTAILERFDRRDRFEAVVARETVPESKPDPTPLLACLEDLDVAPGNALFVGDKESDAETAHRAGASFLHPDQIRP